MKEDAPSWIAAIAAVFAVGIRFTHNAVLSVLVSGILIILMGLVSVLGHVFHVPAMYTWFGDPPGMAAETAVIFMIIGSGKIWIVSAIRKLTLHFPADAHREPI